jgi:mono/diheme cytochrome c family protein
MRKLPIISLLLVALTVIAVSCSDVKRNRGKVYMPDMADSRAYETYSASPIFADGQTNREPVAGTVKRGELLPFHLAKDKTGDTANYVGSKLVKSPLVAMSDVEKKEAERLFLINCAICHGAKLDGNGPLWKDGDGPFPSKPAQLVGDARYENMPEGQMFYSVTYGKNLMGSYASQLDRKQRWMVIAYIKSKQSKPAAAIATAAPAAAPAKDSAAAKTTAK